MSLVDTQAPDFELERTGGGTVRLSETLDDGPTVVLLNRGVWCSYCAEQLQTFSNHAYDMWRHQGVDVLPITSDPVGDLAEMRDRFDLRIQLLSDPDLDVAEAYTGVEETDEHGPIPIAGTFVVDTAGVVRYEQVSENPADRTYANFVRHFVRIGYEQPYDE
jgi:peroxiredoxin